MLRWRRRTACVALALALAPRTRGADYGSCRDNVFTGLSADCNLNAAGSKQACCQRLSLVETARCFCSQEILAAVVAAVGPDGVTFFASFANASCSGLTLTVGSACPRRPPLPPAPAPPTPGPPPVPQVVAPPRAPQTAAPPPPPLYSAPLTPAASGGRALGDIVCNPMLPQLLPNSLGFLCDALTATGLLALLGGPGPFTVFAPCNTAWYATLVQLGVTRDELFEDPSLTEVVANHIARGVVPTGSLAYGQTIATLHSQSPAVARELRAAAASGMSADQAYTALNADLQVEVYQNTIFKHVFVAGCQITCPDVRASNGILHVIDCTLLPPPPQALPTLRSVGQLIRERFELSLLEQALAGTGLLAAVDAATTAAPVTAFAPSNAAFARYAASSPGFFISDATGRAVNPGVPGLRDVLKYGLVVGRYTSSTLSTLTSPLQSVQGASLYLDVIRGIYKSYLYVNGCKARVMDLMASNGVIHILECVPQPNFQPQPKA